MVHLPFLFRQNTGDLVLERLGKFHISPLFRVTASACTAHIYVTGMSGKGKSKLLEYCLYQDIAAGQGGGPPTPRADARPAACPDRRSGLISSQTAC